MREVVLVPGLWMPGAAMGLLAARLERRGHPVRIFAYQGRSALEANVDSLRAYLRGADTHLIGHSLGGVLALEMLNRHPDVRASSLLLLGSPVRGCYAGRRLGLAGIGRWMLGHSRPLWEERPAVWRRREAPLGIIAGTVAFGLGRALGSLPGENDGVVCVSETEVEGESSRAHVPLGHSALIVSPRVAHLAARFLSAGRLDA
jgi:pimeloyl-ACP methyl ester carboxylesterase